MAHADCVCPVWACAWTESEHIMQVLKRTIQTAVVWTLYEELVPRVTRMAEALRHSTPRS